MILNIFGDIWKGLVNLSNQFRDFIVNNYTNPVLWIGLFLGGFLIFKAVHSALDKGER